MAESTTPLPLNVSRAFVQTYYQTLAEDASKMQAFYVPDATMSHCDDPKAVGTEAIAAKHCELARAIPNCCVEIDHIMCSQYDNFIIVTLWGFLGPKDGMSNKFLQTFTLKCIGNQRYALASDMFSYARTKRVSTTESAPRPAAAEAASAVSSAPAKAPPAQAAAAPAAAPASAPAPAATPAPAPAAEVKKSKVESKAQAPAKEEVAAKDAPAAEAPAGSVPQKAKDSSKAAPKPAEAKPKVEQVVAEPTVVSLEPERKKTFAELCASKSSERAAAVAPTPAPAPAAASAPKSKPQAAGNKPAASKGAQPAKDGERPSRQRSSENSASSRAEGNKIDPKGVFASRIPAEATETDIRAAFEAYGPISDLKVKTRENSFSLAFISYESAEGAQAALKTESVVICGTDALVQELKDKPMHSRGRSNGGRGGRNNRGGQRGPRPERPGNQQTQKR